MAASVALRAGGGKAPPPFAAPLKLPPFTAFAFGRDENVYRAQNLTCLCIVSFCLQEKLRQLLFQRLREFKGQQK